MLRASLIQLKYTLKHWKSTFSYLLASIVHNLLEFGLCTGLRMNVGKATIILRGVGVHEDMERFRLSISSKVGYLGIMIGHVNPEELCAKAIAVG